MHINPSHKIVILYTTHFVDSFTLSQYRKLKEETSDHADVVFLVQTDMLEEDIPDDIVYYPFSLECLNELGYKPISESIVPGSAHFSFLQFYKDYPNYEYYWNVEYDVVFSGNWHTFFDAFSDIDTDYIASHIHSYAEKSAEENSLWPWWKTFCLVDIDLKQEEYLKAFNPVYRLSNRAIAMLDKVQSAGNMGHHEVMIPTMVHYNKFSIGEMGGSGRFVLPGFQGLFYTDSLEEVCYRPSTMRFRPVYSNRQEITLSNKLYHPVKF
ncbi:MAG: DUF3405 domain-containing protein [Bacteroidales bacterium]|nr:DUF3405 domain-containing protein [Bacteroidales bacterium]